MCSGRSVKRSSPSATMSAAIFLVEDEALIRRHYAGVTPVWLLNAGWNAASD